MDRWKKPIHRGEGGKPPNGEVSGAGPTAEAAGNRRAGLDGAAGTILWALAADLAPLPASVSPFRSKSSMLGWSSCTSRAQ